MTFVLTFISSIRSKINTRDYFKLNQDLSALKDTKHILISDAALEQFIALTRQIFQMLLNLLNGGMCKRMHFEFESATPINKSAASMIAQFEVHVRL